MSQNMIEQVVLHLNTTWTKDIPAYPLHDNAEDMFTIY
jgi:hypothetical protein